MSFDINPADEDPHGECRHEIHRLQQENAILSSGVTCFGCGAAYSPDIANGPCDSAHRETWPHEWINQRTRDAIAKSCEHIGTIATLQARLALWDWLTSMCCNVVKNSVIGGPAWVVCDVDGEAIGGGMSPEEAIVSAHRRVEGLCE